MDALMAYMDDTYTKIRLLRRTDKSEVWLAADRAGQLAVIKRLALTGLPLAALQKADCPLCPKIYSYAEADGETLLVEEHIPGGSLGVRELTEKEATQLLLSIAGGLALLHAHGIIHLDIKPSNLLLEKSGQIRLIDFDAARLIKEECIEDTTRLGTKGYAPPEQFGYGQTDQRSDIYALGMTFKRLLPKDYHGFLLPILRKCTAMDPNDRYQSAMELATAIRRCHLLKKIRIPLAAVLCLGLLPAALYLPAPAPATDEIRIETAPPDQKQDATAQTDLPAKTNRQPSSPIPEIAGFGQAPPAAPLPEPAAPPAPAPPVTETPASIALPQESLPQPEEIIPRGQTTAILYWNGASTGGNSSTLNITPSQWQAGQASITIHNDSNLPRESSNIKIIYSSNYGQKATTYTNLPTIEPGQSAQIPVPCGEAFPVEAQTRTVWVQMYLEKSNVTDQDKYWCLQFELEGESQ